MSHRTLGGSLPKQKKTVVDDPCGFVLLPVASMPSRGSMFALRSRSPVVSMVRADGISLPTWKTPG